MRAIKEITSIVKKCAIHVAEHYANVNCPFFTYQPALPDSVKKLSTSKKNMKR